MTRHAFSKLSSSLSKNNLSHQGQCHCYRFVPKTDEQSNIHILKGTGCSSVVGRSGLGEQPVSLGIGCSQKGVIIHELMHAIGKEL